jgi:hypothetical protein
MAPSFINNEAFVLFLQEALSADIGKLANVAKDASLEEIRQFVDEAEGLSRSAANIVSKINRRLAVAGG